MEANARSSERTATAATVNGMPAELLEGMVGAMAEAPEAGAVRASVRHRWDKGFGVDGATDQVEQGGAVFPGTHTFRTDWPAPFGADSGPTPGAEMVLAAVGACVATTYVAKAALRGVELQSLEVETVGRVDLRGLFEVDESVPPRFGSISVEVEVEADADEAVLEELGRTVSGASPAFDSLANPVPIELVVNAG